MGGTISSSDKRRQVKGGIFIQLQKTVFVSNEVITGTLCINLEEKFQGHILQIALEGLEETHYTYVTYSGSGKHKRSRVVYNNGLNQFLNFSLPVYDFAMEQISTSPFYLKPGQWQIPFSLSVADNLPSSMTYFGTESNRCQVKYTLKASILSTDVNVRPVEGAQEILIGQQIDLPLYSPCAELDSTPTLYCCYCCKHGAMKLKATVEKNQYAPSEAIKIQLDCDFSGYKYKINFLTISLIGRLQLKANKIGVMKYIAIKAQTIQSPVRGIKATETVSLIVPQDINLTTEGDFVELKYSIQILPDVSTCCCVEINKPLFITVTINPTKESLAVHAFPEMRKVEAPANWNPVQLQQPKFTDQQTLEIQKQLATYQQYELAMLEQQQDIIGQLQGPAMTAVGGNGGENIYL